VENSKCDVIADCAPLLPRIKRGEAVIYITQTIIFI